MTAIVKGTGLGLIACGLRRTIPVIALGFVGALACGYPIEQVVPATIIIALVLGIVGGLVFRDRRPKPSA